MPKVSRKIKPDALAGREIELKFLIDPRDLEGLAKLPVIGRSLAQAKSAKLITTYFDTEDRRLEKSGLTMRLRKIGRKRVLTVKQIEKAAIGRAEWERSVKSDRPAAADYAASPAGAVLGKSATALAPLFASDVARRAALIARSGSRIELALDKGRIANGDAEIPICEIELELKRGKPAHLIALARRLVTTAPLHLSFISKAERGERLAKGKWGKPQRASTPALDEKMSALTAFLAIGRVCLHDFMLNEPALAGKDPVEGVHQARIAIRRLRAAFNLFSPLIAHPKFEGLQGELKFLSDLLGEARDYDVLATDFLVDPKSKLGLAIAERREKAHRALVAGLAAVRMRLFRLDLAVWLDAGSWTPAQARCLSADIRDVAKKRLARRLKKLLKRTRQLETLDDHERHRVRIAAKRLRYMCEFFATLLSAKKEKRRFDRLLAKLEQMQDELGALQDEVTFAKLVSEVSGEAESGEVAPSPADHAIHLRKAVKAAAAIGKAKPFWLKW
jgi:inorganic triphosphatase YgiF